MRRRRRGGSWHPSLAEEGVATWRLASGMVVAPLLQLLPVAVLVGPTQTTLPLPFTPRLLPPPLPPLAAAAAPVLQVKGRRTWGSWWGQRGRVWTAWCAWSPSPSPAPAGTTAPHPVTTSFTPPASSRGCRRKWSAPRAGLCFQSPDVAAKHNSRALAPWGVGAKAGMALINPPLPLGEGVRGGGRGLNFLFLLHSI